MIVILFYIYVA